MSFTGSVGAGRAIAARAGQRLVSCMLELGGKSPNIVFDDANLDQAEAGVLAGIFAAAGQTCVAGSRAYIHEPIYDAFVDRLVGRAQTDHARRSVEARRRRWGRSRRRCSSRRTSRWCSAPSARARRCCAAARRPQLAEFPDGYFYEPTIVHQAAKDNFLMRNEVFGPVLAVTPFKDEAEVLALANDTEFGLAAGVWTRDVDRVHKMARQLEAGTVWVNTYRALTFNSPFGGYKASGIGRQNGIEAVYQYLQTKSVWCELGDEIQDPFIMKV